MGLLSLPGPAGAGPGSCGPADGDRAVRPPTRPLHPPPPVGETLPALLRLHRAATEAADPGTDLPAARLPAASGPGVDVPVTAGAGLSAGFGRRASAPAGFALSSIGIADVAPLLGAAAEGYASDFRASARGPLMCGLYLLALRVEGLPVGGYRCAVETGRLEPVGTWPGRPALTGGLRPETALVLGEAAAVLFPVGDPSAAVPGIGDRWYRLQQTEAGIMVHRAALAAAAINLAARLHSDLCTPAVDAALGLGRTPLRTLSALAVGAPPPRTLLRWAG